MDQATQVLQRNQEIFRSSGRLLVYGPPASESLNFIASDTVVTPDYRVYCSLSEEKNLQVQFGLGEIEAGDFDGAVVYLPKAKTELEMVLAYLGSMLSQNARIYLVGEKKAGIQSAAKKLSMLGADMEKIDSAKHCQLWCVSLEKQVPPFELDAWMEQVEVLVGNQTFALCSLPGTFSAGRLDEGTALLLDNLPKKVAGRVLDFACGNGVIGIFLAKRFPDIAIEMVDINWMALECARLNCEQHSIEATIFPSDGLSEVQGRVDSIFTNPPFHSGVATEYQTTETFLRQAPDKMNKNARLYCVANSFLRYPGLIESSLGNCQTVAETSKFRLYCARR